MSIDTVMVRPPRCSLVNVTTGEAMDCLFNPTQLSEKVQVNWNRLAVPGLSKLSKAAQGHSGIPSPPKATG